MVNQPINNPKDYQVVSFHNSTAFDFTPDMGCMYDGRAIHGKTGKGIVSGETLILPYHVGHRLAVNLAKATMLRASNGTPILDAQGNPMIKSLWDDKGLEDLKNTYIKDLYSEEKPISQSQTDILMEKVEMLNKMVLDMKGDKKTEQPPVDNDHVAVGASQFPAVDNKVYQDKAEVIAELDKRKVKYDKRKSKAELEKLLA